MTTRAAAFAWPSRRRARATWLVASWAAANNFDDARYLDAATAYGIHTREPRFLLV